MRLGTAKPRVAPPCPREALATQAARRRESLAALSDMLGHAPGYLARFVREGVPCALSQRDHRRLALHCGVSEREMGVRELWAGEQATDY